MNKQDGYHRDKDDEASIQMCLSCTKPKCTNCLEYSNKPKRARQPHIKFEENDVRLSKPHKI